MQAVEQAVSTKTGHPLIDPRSRDCIPKIARRGGQLFSSVASSYEDAMHSINQRLRIALATRGLTLLSNIALQGAPRYCHASTLQRGAGNS